jgi:hypothetical protein
MHFRQPKLYLNLLEFPLDDEEISREYTIDVHTLAELFPIERDSMGGKVEYY